MVSEDIAYLPTDHPHRLERVSDEDARGFSVFLPDGELPTTELVVVHRREIIVYERVGVDELESEEIRQDSIAREPHDFFVHDHREYRAYALSLSLHRIADRFLELIFPHRSDMTVAPIEVFFERCVYLFLI
jgi:hypothetical protein